MSILRFAAVTLSVLMVLSFVAPDASGQSAEAFMSVDVAGSTMDVSVFVRQTGSTAWKLGMSSFVFRFDTTAIAFDSELAEGIWDDSQFPGSYGDQFSARYHHGMARSIEIDFIGASGSGVPISMLPALVGSLRFTVKDAGKNPAIQWSGDASFLSDDLGIERTSSITFTNPIVGGVEEETIPEVFALDQNYPNPFNPTTTIHYSVPTQSQVRVEVFNVIGERIALLVDQVQNAGFHSVEFDASALPSGFYLYRLATPQGGFVRKMLLLK